MFDLDAPIPDASRYHGSPQWHWLAASQRWAAGRISCALCGTLWPDALAREMEFDRIDAKGPYTFRNCQLACPSCNRAKGDRPQAEAIAYIASMRGLSAWERARESRRHAVRRWQASPQGIAYRDAQREKKNAVERQRYQSDPAYRARQLASSAERKRERTPVKRLPGQRPLA